MPLFQVNLPTNAMSRVVPMTFKEVDVRERDHLQELLCENPSALEQAIEEKLFIISKEYSNWENCNRRVDLLAIDKGLRSEDSPIVTVNLVVMELKVEEGGGHIELQSIRYAAMLSNMNFDAVVQAYEKFSNKTFDVAKSELLKFLQEPELEQDSELEQDTEPRKNLAFEHVLVSKKPRIILIAPSFNPEITTAVLWLNECGLDIQCVEATPYEIQSELYVGLEALIPLPEAKEYIVQRREKSQKEESAISRREGRDTGYFFMNTGDGSNEGRSWKDCYKYGFMIAGGGEKWQSNIKRLKVGNKVCAYLSGHGYVGIGDVIAEAVPQRDFIPAGQSKLLTDLPLQAKPQPDRLNDELKCDWCVGVRWIHKLKEENAVPKIKAPPSAFQAIKQQTFVDKLLEAFKRAADTK